MDSIRNIYNLCPKVLLWNSKIASGNISADTIEKVKTYLHDERLYDVHVSVNQYKPKTLWKRTFSNPKTSWLSKLTLGVTMCLVETLAVPKLWIGDHYDPLSNTVHLYSDDPAVALHECGHAKDFNSRKNPILYLAITRLPAQFLPNFFSAQLPLLATEYVASRNAIDYLQNTRSAEAVSHAYRVLVPAFTAYIAFPLIFEGFRSPVCLQSKNILNLASANFQWECEDIPSYGIAGLAGPLAMLTSHVVARMLGNKAKRALQKDA